MTGWGDAHRSGAALSAQLHADLDIKLDRPVDVFGAIERLGLVLAFAPLGKVSGLYMPDGLSRGILIHSGHPRTRQRYTAAHELGHHMFGHELEVDADLEVALRVRSGRQWTQPEREAEAFAAWFLMPRRLLKSGLKQLSISSIDTPLDAYQLSLWAGTSYTATVRQLGITRLIPTRTADTWSQIRPRDLKAALAGEMAPDDMRNDVWWLDLRHHQHPVDVRPGDRMVVTVSEVPSSGFVWRLVDLPEGIRLVADSLTGDWRPSIEGTPVETELAGGEHPRWFVLDVDKEAPPAIERLALVKDRPWGNDGVVDDYELLVAVNPPLYGIQISEEEYSLNV